MIAAIIALAVIVILLDVPPLLQKKYTKELWVFSTVLLLGTLWGIFASLRMDWPTPVVLLEIAYRPLSDAISQWLQ